MKKVYALSIAILLFASSINAQCRRNEIGIGIGISQIYFSPDYEISGNLKDDIFQLTRINPRSVRYTQKTSSRTLPALYYSYKINRNVKFRSSLNMYQEKRELGYMDCGTGAEASEYNATFNQVRISTGLSKNLSNCSCMKVFMNADVAHYFEFANEKGVRNRFSETGSAGESFNAKTTTYSIGFNPSIGLCKALCHGMSFSYEFGAEVKYNTGNYSSVNFILTPLNRLSLNYSF